LIFILFYLKKIVPYGVFHNFSTLFPPSPSSFPFRPSHHSLFPSLSSNLLQLNRGMCGDWVRPDSNPGPVNCQDCQSATYQSTPLITLIIDFYYFIYILYNVFNNFSILIECLNMYCIFVYFWIKFLSLLRNNCIKYIHT